MDATVTNHKTDDYAKLQQSAQHTIMMLAAQFLLGMAVNLIGLPSETSDGAKVTTTISLTLHVLIAVGLVVGAFMTIRAAHKLSQSLRQLARFAAASVGITFVAGVLTMATDNSWWSYLMAAGFMVSVLLYGAILVRPKSS